jgi:peptide/nickel transport system substrate-binding protein
MYGYDPTKAKQLLADAGYASGFECQLWFVAYDPELKSAIQAVADQLGQVGVKVTLQQFESSSYIPRITTKTDERDLFITNRSIVGTDANLTRLWTKNEWDSDNRGRFYNQQYEDLIVQARSKLDPKVRAPLYAQAQQILRDQAAEVFLWGKQVLTVARANVDGFEVFPDASIHMDRVTKA